MVSRTLWDLGSNRVLIMEEFTKDNNLVSRYVTYKMEGVGSNKFSAVAIINNDFSYLDLLTLLMK